MSSDTAKLLQQPGNRGFFSVEKLGSDKQHHLSATPVVLEALSSLVKALVKPRLTAAYSALQVGVWSLTGSKSHLRSLWLSLLLTANVRSFWGTAGSGCLWVKRPHGFYFFFLI